MSRRDWFRLRVPHKNKMLDEPGNDRGNLVRDQSKAGQQASDSDACETSPSAAALRPIPHPENHVGLDPAQLPPMREAELSCEQVIALFGDIEKLASDIQLMQRQDHSRFATTQTATTLQLATARDLLISNKIQRLQIRYRWLNDNWIDTLEWRQPAIRLVRIQHRKPSL